jgi:hypothetical protein
MLRYWSVEKYIKTYWSVKVNKAKKYQLTLKDGTVVSYTKDEQGEIQYKPEPDLDPKIAKARWDEIYDKAYKKAGSH